MFDAMFFVGFLSRIQQWGRNRAERNTVSATGNNKQGDKSQQTNRAQMCCNTNIFQIITCCYCTVTSCAMMKCAPFMYFKLSSVYLMGFKSVTQKNDAATICRQAPDNNKGVYELSHWTETTHVHKCNERKWSGETMIAYRKRLRGAEERRESDIE